ncbi:MAG: VCBS repeat-containing protein [Acidobacteriota bacterium]|nr:VCBS repeat-containing protein [Acidobacteriota bacterium]
MRQNFLSNLFLITFTLVFSTQSALSNNNYWCSHNTAQPERAFGDVDGDGAPDRAWFQNGEMQVALSHGRGPGREAAYAPDQTWLIYDEARQQPAFIKLADVDGDRRADLVMFTRKQVLVAYSEGNNFTYPEVWLDLPVMGNDWFMSLEDQNGDGMVDLRATSKNYKFTATSNGERFEYRAPRVGKTGGEDLDVFAQLVDCQSDCTPRVYGQGYNFSIASLTSAWPDGTVIASQTYADNEFPVPTSVTRLQFFLNFDLSNFSDPNGTAASWQTDFQVTNVTADYQSESGTVVQEMNILSTSQEAHYGNDPNFPESVTTRVQIDCLNSTLLPNYTLDLANQNLSDLVLIDPPPGSGGN